MSGRNKGFDPLSSLFEAPEPGLAAAPAPAPPAAAELPTAPPAAAELLPAPAVAAPAAAVAPAGAVPDPGAVDLPRPKKAPEVDKAAIAKAVAAAAAARLKAQQAKPAPAPAPKPAPASKPATKKPAPKKPRSRLDALAARAVRPKGDALAAARAAAAKETKAAEHSAEVSRQAHVQKVRDQVEALVPTLLPGVSSVRVVNAIIVDQRDVLKALWTAHRTKFIQDGQLERAVGAAVVLQAVATVGPGSLVAAHVETSASDYLVWIDVARNQVLAAFPNARAYFSAS